MPALRSTGLLPARAMVTLRSAPPAALSYTVSSSAPLVAARAAGSCVTLNRASWGAASILVSASDAGGLSAVQRFTARVVGTATGAFLDDPIVAGVTPIKAIHFTELRMRIDAARGAFGLGRVAWTDSVLTPGATRVQVVHLLELREALVAAYGAAGRSAPGWTDATPVGGATPIRALHVMELRAAVAALERRLLQ